MQMPHVICYFTASMWLVTVRFRVIVCFGAITVRYLDIAIKQYPLVEFVANVLPKERATAEMECNSV